MSYLVVFDGIDGSGKSAQAELLRKHLEENNYKVILTEEPWTGGLRPQIKKAMKSHEASESDILNMLLEDRTMHIEQIIEPALEQGIIVICDRFKPATYAYQQSMFSLDYLKKVSRHHMDADLCIIIDTSIDTALARIEQANRDKSDESERYERRPFLTGLKQRYLDIVKNKDIPNMFIVNGEPSKEIVFSDVLSLYNKLKDGKLHTLE
jgi:dTMP kinase